MKPELDLLCEIRVRLLESLEVGATPDGVRRFTMIGGGTFDGAQLRGTVLPGGADSLYVRPDGVAVLSARYVLRTSDDVLIHVDNRGIRHGAKDVMARLAAGEQVDPGEYYFRTTPTFSAPAGNYEWLNRSIFLATAARHAHSVDVWVYRVK
ncbi:MAG TPA: DUF3237 domain-containing protein [Steroidobacteraceae bacterium]|nr:DUF3237 domain-containing protein [Steroidobacteraceae bacterium]